MTVRLGPDVRDRAADDHDQREVLLTLVVDPTVDAPSEAIERVLGAIDGDLQTAVGRGIYRATVPVRRFDRFEDFSDVLEYVGTPDTEATVEDM